MKVYRVVVEHDGPIAPEHVYRYAAESIKDVWAAISWLLDDPERTVVLIMEEAPAITVLTAGKEKP
jgi:hypothetical protein